MGREIGLASGGADVGVELAHADELKDAPGEEELLAGAEHADEILAEKIDLLLKKHKGNLPIKMQVFDVDQQLQLPMICPKKIQLSSELLEELDSIGLSYKLN